MIGEMIIAGSLVAGAILAAASLLRKAILELKQPEVTTVPLHIDSDAMEEYKQKVLKARPWAEPIVPDNMVVVPESTGHKVAIQEETSEAPQGVDALKALRKK